jgi:hypothetical protein
MLHHTRYSCYNTSHVYEHVHSYVCVGGWLLQAAAGAVTTVADGAVTLSKVMAACFLLLFVSCALQQRMVCMHELWVTSLQEQYTQHTAFNISRATSAAQLGVEKHATAHSTGRVTPLHKGDSCSTTTEQSLLEILCVAEKVECCTK